MCAQDVATDGADIQTEELADSTVMQTIDWLLDTPLEKDPIKRYDLQTQFLNWLATTEKVTVKVDFKVVNFIEKNPDLLYYFFCGWVDYAYKHNLKVDELGANEAGVTTVVNFYNKNRRMFAQDKNVEAYDKLMKKGKLREHIEKMMLGNSLSDVWKALNK